MGLSLRFVLGIDELANENPIQRHRHVGGASSGVDGLYKYLYYPRWFVGAGQNACLAWQRALRCPPLSSGGAPPCRLSASTRPAGSRPERLEADVEGAHRLFYVATFAEAVYVLHAFEKKTRKTTARDLEIGRERFRSLMAKRRKNDGSKK
jgi:hypothetical protein